MSERPVFNPFEMVLLPDGDFEDAALRYEQLGFHETVAHIKAGLPVEGVTHLVDTPSSRIYEVTHDSLELILRITTPTKYREDGLTTDEAFQEQLTALILAQGNETFEQLFTFNFGDKAIYTRRVSGMQVDLLPTAVVEKITPEQVHAAALGISAGAQNGIVLDGDVTNYFYDPVDWFTIIDFYMENDTYSAIAAREFTQFLQAINQSVTSETNAEHRAAWKRVLRIGLQILHDNDMNPRDFFPVTSSHFDWVLSN